MQKVILIGGTGLTGSHLIQKLAENVELISLQRRAVSNQAYESVYETLDTNLLNTLSYDDAHFVCCLGTTIKQAGSKESFFAIDYDLIVAFAKMAKRSNALSFHFISATEANANSLFFYNQVKGQTEDQIQSLGLDRCYCYRPSLIIGNRQQKRFAEQLAINTFQGISKIFSTNIQKKLGTKVEDIVLSICKNLKSPQPGFHIVNPSDF